MNELLHLAFSMTDPDWVPSDDEDKTKEDKPNIMTSTHTQFYGSFDMARQTDVYSTKPDKSINKRQHIVV